MKRTVLKEYFPACGVDIKHIRMLRFFQEEFFTRAEDNASKLCWNWKFMQNDFIE